MPSHAREWVCLPATSVGGNLLYALVRILKSVFIIFCFCYFRGNRPKNILERFFSFRRRKMTTTSASMTVCHFLQHKNLYVAELQLLNTSEKVVLFWLNDLLTIGKRSCSVCCCWDMNPRLVLFALMSQAMLVSVEGFSSHHSTVPLKK